MKMSKTTLTSSQPFLSVAMPPILLMALTIPSSKARKQHELLEKPRRRARSRIITQENTLHQSHRPTAIAEEVIDPAIALDEDMAIAIITIDLATTATIHIVEGTIAATTIIRKTTDAKIAAETMKRMAGMATTNDHQQITIMGSPMANPITLQRRINTVLPAQDLAPTAGEEAKAALSPVAHKAEVKAATNLMPLITWN